MPRSVTPTVSEYRVASPCIVPRDRLECLVLWSGMSYYCDDRDHDRCASADIDLMFMPKSGSLHWPLVKPISGLRHQSFLGKYMSTTTYT